LDGGLTWASPDRQFGLGTGAFSPCIAVHGPQVTLAWYDYRNGNAGADIFSNTSQDAGISWLPSDNRLDVGSPPHTYASNNPRIAAAGSLVYVAWEEYRGTQHPRIYGSRSLDAGNTWLATDVRLDNGNTAFIGGAYSPDVAASGSSVFVAWADQ